MIRTNFGGVFLYEKEKISFGLAKVEDIDEIEQMYREIAIHSKNYQLRFKENGRYCFAKVGGMYEILTKQDILNLLKDDTSLFAVAKKPNGKIVATFWFSQTDPYLSNYFPDKEKFTEYMDIYEKIVMAKKNHTMVYPRELIVCAVQPPPKIAFLMFYSIFVAMYRLGYTHSLCEVYKIISYNDGNGKKEIHMLNEKSFDMTSHTGGIFIDQAPLRTICLEGLEVVIQAQIFYFDYETLIPKLEKYFEKNHIKIRWANECETRN